MLIKGRYNSNSSLHNIVARHGELKATRQRLDSSIQAPNATFVQKNLRVHRNRYMICMCYATYMNSRSRGKMWKNSALYFILCTVYQIDQNILCINITESSHAFIRKIQKFYFLSLNQALICS